MTDFQFINLNGTKICYAVEGSGPPCFVIGFGRYTARLLSPAWREHFQLIFTDYRGLDPADTGFDIDTLNLPNLLGDIDALRQYLRLDVITILGHSTAGVLALDYTLACPRHVSHLLLLCSPPVYTTGFRQQQQDHMQEELLGERARIFHQNLKQFNQIKSALAGQDFFFQFGRAQAPVYWYDPRFDESVFWQGINLNVDIINQFVPRVYNEHDMTARFPEIRVPVFLALGRYDFATPYNIWDGHTASIRDLTIKLYTQSSHYPMVDEREQFDRDVMQWYQSRV